MDETEPQWLSASELASWGSLASMVMWLPPALDDQLRRTSGLTFFEYGVLAVLSEQPEHTMRLRDLAVFGNSSLSRLSRVLDRFAALGWVERRVDPNDGRITLAVLTSGGYEKVVDTAPAHVKRVRELVFDPLTTEEVEHLGRISAKIFAAVGPHGAGAHRLS